MQGQLHSTTAGTKLISGRKSHRTSAPASEFSAHSWRIMTVFTARGHRTNTSPTPAGNNRVGVPADAR